jgi:hypothetical protein
LAAAAYMFFSLLPDIGSFFSIGGTRIPGFVMLLKQKLCHVTETEEDAYGRRLLRKKITARKKPVAAAARAPPKISLRVNPAWT